jgi:integrase/recombinase XerD
LLAQASRKVKGFSEEIQKLKVNLSVDGKSKSTFQNYARHLATLSLHFNALPSSLSQEQIKNYLYQLQQTHPTPCESYFKHTVFGLRALFKVENLDADHIQLPTIKRSNKLPVVLSKPEMKRLLVAPNLLKHRILIGLLYGCGLRCMEARNVQLNDLDFERAMLHVRQGKGAKDRYVPLSQHLIRGLKTYISKEKPQQWLFNGQPQERKGGDFDSRYSQRGVQWAVSEAARKAGITKDISTHTLRHTYATHLLEDGLDILTIKNLMGHVNIETTMIYLHVAQSGNNKAFSPLDTLYPI